MSPADPSPLPPGTPQAYAPNRYRLGAGWEAEVEHPADIFRAEIEEPGGPGVLAAFTKHRGSGFYRVLHGIELEPAGLIDIVICYDCTASHADFLDEAGVLQEAPDGQRRFIATATHTFNLAKDRTVSGSGIVRLDPSGIGAGNLYLAFQCASAPGRLEISNFHIETFGPNWLEDLLIEDASRSAASAEPGASHPKTAAAPRQAADDALNDPADFLVAVRKTILTAAADAAAEHRTPYYRLLTDAVQITSDLRILAEVERTLSRVDRHRIGSRPALEGPLVSVVMPVRNRAKLVGDAVASVLAQTHQNFELLVCDDASDDSTPAALAELGDSRVRVLRHATRRGAAAARNTCLHEARGTYVAYLDSDNFWHPRFLELMLEELQRWPGHVAAYASYFDVQTDALGRSFFRDTAIRRFDLEDQIEAPFVDLNSFVHRRELVEVLGGFDERLVRRQDYDLIVRYAWAREPRHAPVALNLYRRIVKLDQITQTQREDTSAPGIISGKIDSYYRSGLPAPLPGWLKKATIVSWDMSRNHFAKAFSVAEALSRHIDVQLISFRFFEEPVFRPLASAAPPFELLSFDGADFPDFFETLSRAVDAVSGDLIYAVKPRLPSFGLALLANARTGKPIFLEANDLETVVASPRTGDRHVSLPLASLFDRLDEARVPHALVWSQILDRCAQAVPTLFTHNVNLDIHYGRRCLTMRNVKDEMVYDPAAFDRDAVREEFGFSAEDRIILFGGLVRRHKGVFELAELVRRLGAPYRLLVVGNRETPDLIELQKSVSGRISILGAQPPERMAALNLAADLVVLWLDPAVPASHYQCPYKLTDALAMGPAIIASPVGELAVLAEHEVLWTVPFGDLNGLAKTIKAILADPVELARRRERGRKLFLREFSYNSVPPAIALAASMVERPDEIYPVATEFAQAFDEFAKRLK
jgi:glycosyltransferase involved in cell wall biosynthesis